MRCFAQFGTICKLKNVKNNHGGVLLLVKSNTPLWVFFAFFILYNDTKNCKASHISIIKLILYAAVNITKSNLTPYARFIITL